MKFCHAHAHAHTPQQNQCSCAKCHSNTTDFHCTWTIYPLNQHTPYPLTFYRILRTDSGKTGAKSDPFHLLGPTAHPCSLLPLEMTSSVIRRVNKKRMEPVYVFSRIFFLITCVILLIKYPPLSGSNGAATNRLVWRAFSGVS